MAAEVSAEVASIGVGVGPAGFGALVFAVSAWRYPRAAGIVLFVVGGMLALIYPSWARGPLEMKLSTELVLFLPPIVAGVLFLAAARAERTGQLPAPR